MEDNVLIEKLLALFKEKKFKGYDTSENQRFNVRKSENAKLPDGSIKDVYVVSLWSLPIFGERDLLFANFDFATGEFLFMGGPHGYISL